MYKNIRIRFLENHPTTFHATIDPTPVIIPPSLAVGGFALIRNPSA